MNLDWNDLLDEVDVVVVDTERHVELLRLNEPLDYCAKACAYGTCGGYPSPGCGGCCGCMGGCQVEHELAQVAPILWEGDYA